MMDHIQPGILDDLPAYSRHLSFLIGSDALFSFTTPISGSDFWCPPINQGSLSLKRLEF